MNRSRIIENIRKRKQVNQNNNDFSFGKKYTSVDFTDMLSESYIDIRKRKQVTEEQEQLLEQQYNTLIEDSMKSVDKIIKEHSKQLKRSIKEHLKLIANENYRDLNTTKGSLLEDLEKEFLQYKSAEISSIISEEVIVNY
jgi:hypothetical protein